MFLHRGDGKPFVGVHAGCSRSRQGSMHLHHFFSPQKCNRHWQTIAGPRTHWDGLGRLRRSGLGRLGFHFHITGQWSNRLKREESQRVCSMEVGVRWVELTAPGLLVVHCIMMVTIVDRPHQRFNVTARVARILRNRPRNWPQLDFEPPDLLDTYGGQ